MENKSMFEILSNMDASVFEGSKDMSEEYTQDLSSTEDLPVLHHDEDIDKNTARRLLGEAFDEACDYKLITTYEDTCIAKIDPRIPADTPPVLDSTGKIIGGHRVEYPLTANDEVLSYTDMMSMLQHGKSEEHTDLTYRRNIYDMKVDKPVKFYVALGIMSILFVIGCALIYFVI